MTDYVLVPREPTREMLATIGDMDMGELYFSTQKKAEEYFAQVYAAMLAAAPSPWRLRADLPPEYRTSGDPPAFQAWDGHSQVVLRYAWHDGGPVFQDYGRSDFTHWHPLIPPPEHPHG